MPIQLGWLARSAVLISRSDSPWSTISVFVCEILVDDIPGRITGVLPAADAETLTLPERVIHQARVFAELSIVEHFIIGPGFAGRYVDRNSRNGRSPIKQIPVLSFLS